MLKIQYLCVFCVCCLLYLVCWSTFSLESLPWCPAATKWFPHTPYNSTIFSLFIHYFHFLPTTFTFKLKALFSQLFNPIPCVPPLLPGPQQTHILPYTQYKNFFLQLNLAFEFLQILNQRKNDKKNSTFHYNIFIILALEQQEKLYLFIFFSIHSWLAIS